jgi:transposase
LVASVGPEGAGGKEESVVGRGELTDAAWDKLQPLLPGNRHRGGQWRDHRQVINGISWKCRTGAPWQDVPQRYGPWTTLHDRLVRWRRDGTWDRLLADVQTSADAVGELEWVGSVDATVNRAHQHAAGAPSACHGRAASRKGGWRPRSKALGRWRGG